MLIKTEVTETETLLVIQSTWLLGYGVWRSGVQFLARARTFNFQQDRQCLCLTLRRVHETIVAVEKQYVLRIFVCACVFV